MQNKTCTKSYWHNSSNNLIMLLKYSEVEQYFTSLVVLFWVCKWRRSTQSCNPSNLISCVWYRFFHLMHTILKYVSCTPKFGSSSRSRTQIIVPCPWGSIQCSHISNILDFGVIEHHMLKQPDSHHTQSYKSKEDDKGSSQSVRGKIVYPLSINL